MSENGAALLPRTLQIAEQPQDVDAARELAAQQLTILQQHGIPEEFFALVGAVLQVDAVDRSAALQLLSRLDFDRVEADLREALTRFNVDLIRPCAGGCGLRTRVGDMKTASIPGAAVGYYCETCLARVLARERHRLARRGIRAACARARAAHLPATLTEAQWRQTVEHFDDACAYCGETWYIVEHIIPIEHGGGTTFDNCVPSCYRCNSQKGQRTLTELKRDYPWKQERLEMIEEWLLERQR